MDHAAALGAARLELGARGEMHPPAEDFDPAADGALGGERAAHVHPAAFTQEQNAPALLDSSIGLDAAAHVDQIVEHVLRGRRRDQHRLSASGIDLTGVGDEVCDRLAVGIAQLTGMQIA